MLVSARLYIIISEEYKRHNPYRWLRYKTLFVDESNIKKVVVIHL